MSQPAGNGTDEFVAHRNLLFTVAYEMLGSAADAGATPQKKRAAAATTAAVSRYIGVATPRR